MPSPTKIDKSVQEIQNLGFDDTYNVPTVEQLGHDGQNVQRKNADALATKITTVGSIIYIGIAAPGSSQASAVWQAQKIDQSSGTVITWADGNGNFDNTVTDMTVLSYS